MWTSEINQLLVWPISFGVGVVVSKSVVVVPFDALVVVEVVWVVLAIANLDGRRLVRG